MVILQKPGIFRGSETRSDGRTVADRLDGRSQMNSGQHQKFSSACRIRDPRDFARAYDSGFRAGDGYLLIFASLNGTDQTRVGLSVSRKHGGAVQRNRRKRLLREAARRCRPLLPPGLDLVLIPRQREDFTLGDFCRSLPDLARRLARRMSRPANRDGKSPSDS